jgi:uncharacterized protein (DUF1778 family)
MIHVMGNFPLRLDDETKARWRAAAVREGRSLTNWIMHVCNVAAQTREAEAMLLALLGTESKSADNPEEGVP